MARRSAPARFGRLPTRVCSGGFERSELEKHPDVGPGPGHDGAPV